MKFAFIAEHLSGLPSEARFPRLPRASFIFSTVSNDGAKIRLWTR